MRLILLCSLVFSLATSAQEAPISPGESDWRFVETLAAPMTWHPHWTRTEKGDKEASLQGGVQVVASFPDGDKLLETAYEDLGSFFSAVGIPASGPYRVITEQVPTEVAEAFTLEISANECRIQANDAEGIRRGIYFLEDELLRADGPFLNIGKIEQSPFIKTRISRCFFGPIKRPPMNRDELLDDVDYYPDGYLNRLARDGVNALWLTIELKDLRKTSLNIPVSPDREQRLEKLRKTVAKCRRYGIQVYLFTLEPIYMTPGDPLILAYPELGGITVTGNYAKTFCPSSDTAQTYLRESLYSIFSEVPGLGGLINLSYGEAPTTCLSEAKGPEGHMDCPRCADKKPWETLGASLSAMEQGVHAAAPGANMISWLYVPDGDSEMVLDLVRNTPPGVTVQFNFESGGSKVQLDRARRASDYWLSYVGPSDSFRRVASNVNPDAAGMAAKIQACNSHEVASVPFIPVPGQLFGKYREMRGLGVDTVMQCWYFGNLPSMMNRAASSALPFAPEGMSEEAFLQNLACRDWAAADVPQVVEAWRLFAKAYESYPLSNAFQFYGPVTDGVVWPLHLKPAQRVLGPTWRVDYPISGDRIGEAFSGTHTYPEVLQLCRVLSETWNHGLEKLTALQSKYANEPDRMMDLSVAQALGIQFRSSYNILRFYDLRETLLYGPAETRSATLKTLREIVEEEIGNGATLSALCESNPFLGFHSEAEAYKYFPAKLQWRANRLRELLDTEFVEAEAEVAADEMVFPVLSGMTGEPLAYTCSPAPHGFAAAWRENAAWQAMAADSGVVDVPLTGEPAASWRAVRDADALYVSIQRFAPEGAAPLSASVHIQSAHIYPRRTFELDEQGARNTQLAWHVFDDEWETETTSANGIRTFRFRIPFTVFDGEFDEATYPSRPMRINVQLKPAAAATTSHTWAPLSPAPPMNRLGYGLENPAEMGWLLFLP